jgi:hypothetical protein
MKRLDNILFDPRSRKFWANVNGSLVEISGAKGKDSGGITSVSTLPEQGEQGKIYHNTTDGKYYVYDGSKYSEFGASTIPVVSHHTHIKHGDTELVGQYNLEPNTLYDTGSIEMQVRTVNNVTTASLLLVLNNPDPTIAQCYMFRQTMPVTDSTGTNTVSSYNIDITYPSGSGMTVTVPDAAQEVLDNLEGGHTYEFNILHGALAVMDITDTGE